MTDTVRAVPSLETSEVAISATRPTQDTDGVDISSWHAFTSAGALTACAAFLNGDGTDRTVSSPTGGSGGVEVHAQVLRKNGTKRWALVGFLDSGAAVAVPGNGMAGRELALVSFARRLAIAGTPSAGAPTYFFQPLAVGGE